MTSQDTRSEVGAEASHSGQTAERTSAGKKQKTDDHRRRKRRTLLLTLLALLLLSLCCSVLLWGYYLATRRPLTSLPPASALTKVVKPHYLFSIYGVSEPVGVGVTPAGDRIYVTESGGERLIRAFNREGKALFHFAPPGSRTAGRAPMYIALDQAGQVFVSDRIRRTIDVYDAGGNSRGSLKVPADGWAPMGLRLYGSTFYLTDVSDRAHRVVMTDKNGAIKGTFGSEGTGDGAELWFPNAVVADDLGRLYVSDSNNGRVKVFDGAGELQDIVTGFSLPRGMVLDPEQRLYVVDGVNHFVHVFDISGEHAKRLYTFGDFGSGDGEFNYPNDIALDGTGRLYIADRVNNRVQVWTY